MDEVLEALRIVGDRRTEAMVMFNMSVVLMRMARVNDAVESQRRAVVLGEQTEHPDLNQMRAFLAQLQEMAEG